MRCIQLACTWGFSTRVCRRSSGCSQRQRETAWAGSGTSENGQQPCRERRCPQRKPSALPHLLWCCGGAGGRCEPLRLQPEAAAWKKAPRDGDPRLSVPGAEPFPRRMRGQGPPAGRAHLPRAAPPPVLPRTAAEQPRPGPPEEEAVRRRPPSTSGFPAQPQPAALGRSAGPEPRRAAMAPRRRRGLAAAGSLLPLLCALLRAAADTSTGRVGLAAGAGAGAGGRARPGGPLRRAGPGGSGSARPAVPQPGTGCRGPRKPGGGLCAVLARGRAGKLWGSGCPAPPRPAVAPSPRLGAAARQKPSRLSCRPSSCPLS